MDSTSVSLLRRLREPDHDAAWQRFVDLYAPLIFHWAKNRGLNPTDAADLVQEVLVTLVAKLPEFEYDPTKRFRGWLRTVTRGQRCQTPCVAWRDVRRSVVVARSFRRP